MGEILLLETSEFRNLITETAKQMRVQPTIVEKDIWVCTVLERIFTSDTYKNHFVFKGGTSLSKVFKVINRFSEDIDLILDWRLLDYRNDYDNSPNAERSRTAQERLNKQINDKCGDYLHEVFAPWLHRSLENMPIDDVTVDDSNPAIVEIKYQTPYNSDYLPGRLILEIGPLAAWIPSNWSIIAPYVSEQFSEAIGQHEIPVCTTTAERTFWEKATILHALASKNSVPPARYARHFYDVLMLDRAGVAQKAMLDLSLLGDVVEFKKKFYASSQSRYNLAVPGSFRLIPGEAACAGLRQDYSDMRVMFFSDPPSWEEVIGELERLEFEINQI